MYHKMCGMLLCGALCTPKCHNNGSQEYFHVMYEYSWTTQHGHIKVYLEHNHRRWPATELNLPSPISPSSKTHTHIQRTGTYSQTLPGQGHRHIQQQQWERQHQQQNINFYLMVMVRLLGMWYTCPCVDLLPRFGAQNPPHYIHKDSCSSWCGWKRSLHMPVCVYATTCECDTKSIAKPFTKNFLHSERERECCKCETKRIMHRNVESVESASAIVRGMTCAMTPTKEIVAWINILRG